MPRCACSTQAVYLRLLVGLAGLGLLSATLRAWERLLRAENRVAHDESAAGKENAEADADDAEDFLLAAPQ